MLQNLQGHSWSWLLTTFPFWLQECLSSAPRIEDHHVLDSPKFQELFLLEDSISSLDFSHPAFNVFLELLWTFLCHYIWTLWGEALLLYTFFSYRLPVWMQFHGYLLTLASQSRKRCFSKFLQHYDNILLDCLMLFSWEQVTAAWRRNTTKNMNTHLTIHYTFIDVTVLPPQESQEASMFFCNLCLVEHSLYVCHFSNMLFLELYNYSNKLACKVRTSQEISIYWFPINFCWTVKYHSDFTRFVGIEDTMMRYILSLSQWSRWCLFLSIPFC